MPERIVKTPEESSLLTSYHPDIVSAADESYHAVAIEQDTSRRNLHRRRVCAFVSNALRFSLHIRGYDTFHLGRDLEHGGPHMYLGLETARGLVLIDGTWQQFIPRLKRKPHLPKVFVGTREEVVTCAGDAGVKDKYLDYWMPGNSSRVMEELDGRFSYNLSD